ncbi:MAG: hypothetical protein Q8K75_00135 [Chlamydiales bacterium]|nr:hypothetical protein [Chlamydiales bacterium]
MNNLTSIQNDINYFAENPNQRTQNPRVYNETTLACILEVLSRYYHPDHIATVKFTINRILDYLVEKTPASQPILKLRPTDPENLATYLGGLTTWLKNNYSAYYIKVIEALLLELSTQQQLSEGCISRVEATIGDMHRVVALTPSVKACLLHFINVHHSKHPVAHNSRLWLALANYRFGEEETDQLKPIIWDLAKSVEDSNDVKPQFISGILQALKLYTWSEDEKLTIDRAMVKLVRRATDCISSDSSSLPFSHQSGIATCLPHIAINDSNRGHISRFIDLMSNSECSNVNGDHCKILEAISKLPFHHETQKRYIHHLCGIIENDSATFLTALTIPLYESLKRCKEDHGYSNVDSAISRLEASLREYLAKLNQGQLIEGLLDNENPERRTRLIARISACLSISQEQVEPLESGDLPEVVSARDSNETQPSATSARIAAAVSSPVALLSDNQVVGRRILKALYDHQADILASLLNSNGIPGRISINLSDPLLGRLGMKLFDIAQADTRYCKAIFTRLSIYNSNAPKNHNVFPRSVEPIIGSCPLISPLHAQSFLELWIEAAQQAIEANVPPSNGLALVEESSLVFEPLTYSKNQGVLQFHQFNEAQHRNLISMPMEYRGGKVHGSSAISIPKRPDLIILAKKRPVTRLERRDPNPKRPSTANPTPEMRKTSDMVDPFALPKTLDPTRVQRPYHYQRKTDDIEKVTQRRHIKNLPTTLADLQKIASEYTPAIPVPRERALYQAMFTQLSSADIQSIHNALRSNRTLSIDAPCMYDSKFSSLLVLWVMSGEKCILATQTSDLESFYRHLKKELKAFRESPFTVAWRLKNNENVPIEAIRKAALDESSPLHLRLQLCNMLPPGAEKLQLFQEVYRSPAIETAKRSVEFETFAQGYANPNQASAAYFKNLRRGTDLINVLETFDGLYSVPPTSVLSQVKLASSIEQATALLPNEIFVVTTESILVDYTKDKTLSPDNPRVFIPLSQAEGHRAIYRSVEKGRLMLWDDRSNYKNQLELMRLLDIERCTLRVHEIIKSLPHSPAQYVELLSILVLINKILKTSRFDEKTTRPSVHTVNLRENSVIEYFQPHNRGGRGLRNLGQRHNTMVYLVSSNTPNLKRHIKQLEIDFLFNHFAVQTVTGSAKVRQMAAGTNNEPKIYIVTTGVLPSRIPFPLVVDPLVKDHGILRWHSNRVIRLVTPDTLKDPEYGRIFSGGDVDTIEKVLKDHFQKFTEVYNVPPSVMQAVQNTNRLTPDMLALLCAEITPSSNASRGSLPSAPTTTPSNILEVDNQRLRLVQITPDGSCLFRCFLKSQVLLTANDVVSCRKSIADLIVERREVYEGLLGPEELMSVTNGILFYEGPQKEDYERRLTEVNSHRMSQDPTTDEYNQYTPEFYKCLFDLYIDVVKNTAMWGGYFEIHAIANHFKLRIVTVKNNRVHQVIVPDIGEATRSIYFRAEGNHYDYYEIVT